MRYYSILRPVGPGTFPLDRKPSAIENFDDKKFCEEIQQKAWGYLEYDEPLTEQQIKDYELVPAGLKSWFCVVTNFYDNGKVTSKLVDVVQKATKPDDTFHSGTRCDTYAEWFETRSEAYQHIADAKKA